MSEEPTVMAAAAPESAGGEPRFEVALRQLEEIVRRLEGEDLDLEEALRLFEEGVRLARVCTRALEVTRQKVDLLLSQDGEGEGVLVPFDAGQEST